MESVLGYDFGTGGIKASLFDADGRCVGSGFSAGDVSFARRLGEWTQGNSKGVGK